MKKIVFGLIATVVFGFVGNAQTSESNQELKNFINLNLEKNKISLSVSKVTRYKLEDYINLKRYANIIVEENIKFEPYSLEIIVEDKTYNIHTIPTSDTHAFILTETSDKKIDNVLVVDIVGYDDDNDEYKISWTKSSGNTSNVYRKKHDCRTGAGMVSAAGRVIAFGTYLGCLPCGFVGGAISALGALGYIGCVLTGN